MTTVSKILVANRGEIARRIFRTCRELGIATVAVFADPDVAAPHTTEADEAVRLTSADTYLDVEAILNAAKSSGADAIHPGYGFLSENADFAQAVADAGLTWIGPPAEAIRLMGDKIRARQRMDGAGVPVVPGTLEPLTDAEEAVAIAEEIGFPVMLKAVGGGGGKGIRIVRDAGDLPAQSARQKRVHRRLQQLHLGGLVLSLGGDFRRFKSKSLRRGRSFLFGNFWFCR